MEAWGRRSLKAHVRIATGLGVALALLLAAPASAAFKPVAQFGAPRLGEVVAPLDVERDGGGNTYVLSATTPAVTKFNAAGTPVGVFGQLGTGPGQFESPTAMAVNQSTGEIYVSELNTTQGGLFFRIQRFDSDGEFIGQWGSPGNAEGQFGEFILGIAVNNTTGDVYVAERSRIQRFNADGQFELMWGKDVVPGGGTGPETCAAGCKEGEPGTAEGELDGIAGIATTGNVVFVTEADNARVQRFNATTGAFSLMAGKDVDPGGGAGAETCAAGCKRGVGGGSAPGELADPTGLDINGTTADLWIADQDNHRIQRWDSVLMTYETEFGTEGTGQGQFESARGLSESGGSVLVADTTLSRVQSFDSATSAFQSSFGTPGPGATIFPRGIGVGPGGVYVTDNMDRGLRFDPGGTIISRFGGPGLAPGQFEIPGGVGVAADGTVYVADIARDVVERFDAEGAFLSEWGTPSGAGPGQLQNPGDVAVAPDGSVYVADTANDRVQRFDAVGGFLAEFGSTGTAPGQFQSPLGIAIDPQGNVYVADAGNDRIQRFAADGTFITQWGASGSGDGQFIGPRDVAADGAGNVFVADSENNRIQRFTADGAFIEKIGADGGVGTYGDGPGEFRLPFSVATSAEGFVYVADAFNNRIQRLVGEPELALFGKRSQLYKRPNVSVDCATGPCAVAVAGKVKTTTPRGRAAAKARKPKLKLKRVALSMASGARQIARLRFRKAKKARRILKALLADGGRAKLTVTATATNEAGTAGAKRKIKLKR